MIDLSQDKFAPVPLGPILISSIEEVIGKDFTKAAFDPLLLSGMHVDEKDHSLNTLSLLQLRLENAFGQSGGRGLTLRLGRIFFNRAIRVYGRSLGFSTQEFFLKTMREKISSVLQAVAALFFQFTGREILIEESPTHIYCSLQACPFCLNRKENAPICHFLIGLLQEALLWASGGKIYHVDETKCLACGDEEFRFVIDRTPLI